jgi:hypothetical protein
MEHRRYETDRRKSKYSTKTCPSAALSTTNPICTDPESNPGLCGEDYGSYIASDGIRGGWLLFNLDRRKDGGQELCGQLNPLKPSGYYLHHQV